MLPYDAEVLFATFAQYNRAVFPAQIVAYALALGIITLALRPHRLGARLAGVALGARFVGIALAAFWAWTGAAWHLVHFAPINFVASIYAGLFIAQAALFIWTGAVRGRLALQFRADVFGWAGLALIGYALIAYPVIFGLLGHGWRGAPLAGLMPVPTTLFTLGVLLLVDGRTLWLLVIIPVAWSLIDGWTAWALDIHEDLVLPAASVLVIGLILWIWRHRRRSIADGGVAA